MVQHESSDFLFDRRMKKNGRPGDFFIMSILQFMKFFVIFSLIRRLKEKTIKKKTKLKKQL